MPDVVSIVKLETMRLRADRPLLIIVTTSFLMELFVSMVVFARMIAGMNYLLYVAPSIDLSFVTSYSLFFARQLYTERVVYDYVPYLLSLPLRRFDFAVGRLLGGVSKAFLLTLPALVVVCVLYMSNPLIFLADSLLVIMYSFVIFGFGMILASTINRNEMWFTIRGMAVGVIVFFSSAYYPTSVLPSPLSTIASYNPMTLSLDAFRSLQSGIFLEGDFAELGIWVIFVCVLAYKAYESRTRR